MGVVSFSRYIPIPINEKWDLTVGYVGSTHKHADLNLHTYMHLMAKLDISESSWRRLCGCTGYWDYQVYAHILLYMVLFTWMSQYSFKKDLHCHTFSAHVINYAIFKSTLVFYLLTTHPSNVHRMLYFSNILRQRSRAFSVGLMLYHKLRHSPILHMKQRACKLCLFVRLKLQETTEAIKRTDIRKLRRSMCFPTMWHFDMNRHRQTFAASF